MGGAGPDREGIGPGYAEEVFKCGREMDICSWVESGVDGEVVGG
jgi:hypothetical protein